MTSKIFTGGAIIPYGPLLPLPTTTPDGSLFYKTIDSVEGSAGLYFFGLLPDTNPGFGEQPGLGWVRYTARGQNIRSYTNVCGRKNWR